MQCQDSTNKILAIEKSSSEVRKKPKIVRVQDVGKCLPEFRSLISSQWVFKLPKLGTKLSNHSRKPQDRLDTQRQSHKTNFNAVKKGKITKSKSCHSVRVIPSTSFVDKQKNEKQKDSVQNQLLQYTLLKPVPAHFSTHVFTPSDHQLKQQEVYAQRRIHLNHHGRPVKTSLVNAGQRDLNNPHQQTLYQHAINYNQSGIDSKNSFTKANSSADVDHQNAISPTSEKHKVNAYIPRKNAVYLARRGRPVKNISHVGVSQSDGATGQNVSTENICPRLSETFNQKPLTIKNSGQQIIQLHNLSTQRIIHSTSYKIFTEEKNNLQIDHNTRSRDEKNHEALKNYSCVDPWQMEYMNNMTDNDCAHDHQLWEKTSGRQHTTIKNNIHISQASINDSEKMTDSDHGNDNNIYYDHNSTQGSSDMMWVSMHNRDENIFTNNDDEDQYGGGIETADDNFSQFNENNNQQPSSFADIRIDSNKIVELNYFFDEIHDKFDVHGENDCEGLLSNLRITRCLNWGLRSRIEFQCIKCGHKDHIWTSPQKPSVGLQLNTAAVAGSLTAGIGYSTLQEMLSSLNIRCMSEPTYILHRDKITKVIEKMSDSEMKKAKLEEIALAIEVGDVTKDGVPFITVIIDGAWSKRSYHRSKYDALSGVAVIIGVRTGKVLFCGVRNKACSFCDRADRENRPPSAHICYKNWDKDQPSSGMETDIISEGFMKSINNNDPKYNVIYKRIIADGDSSVYNTIVDLDPYKKHGILVQKIECSNHLYRNFCKHVYDAGQTTTIHHPPTDCSTLYLRDRIKKSGYEMRKYIERAVRKWKDMDCTFTDKITGLRENIKNIVSHTFGDHERCAPNDNECKEHAKMFKGNHIEVLKKNYEILEQINGAVLRLDKHADSLLHNLTNNSAELCNSVLCKEVGGKRINYCCRNSYHLRALCAALQYSEQDVLSKIMLYSGTKIPAVITELEKKRQERNLRVNKYRNENNRRNRWSSKGLDKNYGPSSYLHKKADMSPDEFTAEKKRIIEEMQEDQKNRLQIEKDTRDQSCCELWRAKRRRLITASHFGSICTKKPTTKRAPEVKSIRQVSYRDSPAMKFGRDHESIALALLESDINQTIDKSGLFIDEEHEMLGCSPDGIIKKENAIVEVKSLYKGRALSAKEAIKSVDIYKGIFKDKNKPTEMKESHHYYYQVQGQLHITKSSYCYFVVFTKPDHQGNIHYIKVKPDVKFWEEKMRPNLLSFWENALFPEIVDPRMIRGMEIREPNSVMTAIQGVNKKQDIPKGSKRKKTNKAVVDSTDNSDTEYESDDYNTSTNTSINTMLSNTKNSTENDESDVQMEFNAEDDEIIELVIRNIDEANVINNVLQLQQEQSLLNDDAIQLFMNILEANVPDISPARVLHMSHQHLIRPSAMDRDIAIIGGQQSGHWCCVYQVNDTIRIYDSGSRSNYTHLSPDEKTYLTIRYPTVPIRNIRFMKMKTHQPDQYSCGVYATAFATALAMEDDPETILYSRDVAEMREHMSNIIETKELLPFPME